MAHHHEEEDWLAEVEHREDDYAVGDVRGSACAYQQHQQHRFITISLRRLLCLCEWQEFGALDESDQVMTYRRMEVATEPWQSRLDSLVSKSASITPIPLRPPTLCTLWSA